MQLVKAQPPVDMRIQARDFTALIANLRPKGLQEDSMDPVERTAIADDAVVPRPGAARA
jgi:hypothetical protein